MIIRSIEFLGSAASPKQFPQNNYPQFVLSGRSNVGKSSFINAMLNHNKVARVSQTPGKTRLLNFFLINQSFYFVDVPGYGYANVNKTLKESLKHFIEGYLKRNQPIRLAILLVDIRHAPSDDDITMYQYFKQTGLQVVVVATKVDKVSNNVLFNQKKVIRQTLHLGDHEPFIAFSSETKKGVEETWKFIEENMNPINEE